MFNDVFGQDIHDGDVVVYPARPGGVGPLKLIVAKVDALDFGTGNIYVVPEGKVRPLKISRSDRVAVIRA